MKCGLVRENSSCKNDKVYDKKKVKRIMVLLFVIIVFISLILIVRQVLLNDHNNAEVLIEKGKYTEAIDLLKNMDDDKSELLLGEIYKRYEGYYHHPEKNMYLELNISDNKKIDINLIGEKYEKKIKIREQVIFSGNKAELYYIDSLENQGKCVVSFVDSGIEILLKDICDKEGNAEKNLTMFFSWERKVKESVESYTHTEVTNKMVLDWLDNRTKISELAKQGIELIETDYNIFAVKDTDIKLLMMKYDAPKFEQDMKIAYEHEKDFPDDKDYMFDEFCVMAASAPAGFIIPAKVGKSSEAFFDNNYFVEPCAEVRMPYEEFILSKELEYSDAIAEDTSVFIVSKKSLNDVTIERFRETVYQGSVENYVNENYFSKIIYKDGYIRNMSEEAENDTHFLYSVFFDPEKECDGKAVICRVRKKDMVIDFISEVLYSIDEYGNVDVQWQHLDIMKEYQERYNGTYWRE